jgi:hypothetical protein
MRHLLASEVPPKRGQDGALREGEGGTARTVADVVMAGVETTLGAVQPVTEDPVAR